MLVELQMGTLIFVVSLVVAGAQPERAEERLVQAQPQGTNSSAASLLTYALSISF